ncbi:Cytochrome b561 domain-containing protein [Pseudohyphozyma bogoriensis]|nr:Cytochrome b561 domain-containing protein [Pseudohyphozyma bogoriensis]
MSMSDLVARKTPTHGWDWHDAYTVAHAVMGSVAVIFIAPAGILVARWMRSSPRWYKVHAWLQACFAVFMLISFGLIVVALRGPTRKKNTQLFDKNTVNRRHHKLGFAVTLAVVCQCIFGLIAHYTKAAAAKRSWMRWFHIIFGIVTMATSYAAIWDGFYEYDTTADNASRVPLAIRVIFWILFGASIVAYGGGMFLASKPKAPEATLPDTPMSEKEQSI